MNQHQTISDRKKAACIMNAAKGTAAVRRLMEQRPTWRCARCGAEKMGTAHQMRHTYCSKACMAASYKERMVGEGNPHYKNLKNKVCKACGAEYKSYDKKRKYCSQSCAGNSERNISQLKIISLLPRKKRKRKEIKRKCWRCGDLFVGGRKNKYCSSNCRSEGLKTSMAETALRKREERIKTYGKKCLVCEIIFYSPPSTNRKYCSYKCHLSSGGAIRAGLRAAFMARKYGAKKDANHREIVNAFKQGGADVLDLSTLGHGIPDILVWVSGEWHLVEIKNKSTGYGRRGANKNQRAWANEWKGGPVHIVTSLDDVIAMLNNQMENIKKYGGYNANIEDMK